MDKRNGLPLHCLARHPETNEPVMLTYGVSGYNEVDPSTNVEALNRLMKITDEQVQAMMCGSMFGWDAPGAKIKKSQSGLSELVLLIGVVIGFFGASGFASKYYEDQAHHQQRQIEVLKAGEENDGKVDW